MVYLARISGNEKLFRLDIASGRKTQLTFGTHDDGAAQWLDDDTLVFASTATDPSQPIDPDVARNGKIYNIWTLSLKTGELKQYTDAVGGNLYTVVLKEGSGTPRIGVITYYKGEYELHTLERRDPIVTAASSDFGAPGTNIIDFQSPLSHTLVADKKKKKGTFEKMFMDGRPPVNVGVTSGGDIFGGSAVNFSDVLGDQQFSLYAASISQYRTLSLSYLNLAHRFNYAIQGYSQTQFFYGDARERLLRSDLLRLHRPRPLGRHAHDPRRHGVRHLAVQPLPPGRGVRRDAAVPTSRSTTRACRTISQQYQVGSVRTAAAAIGHLHSARRQLRAGDDGVPRVRTAGRQHDAPVATRLAPNIGNTLSRQTADVDARYYQRLGATGLLALRARGFRSWGDAPDFMYFGGNSEMRGYEYLEFVGDHSAFLNAELRFPLIEAMLTPIGILGGIRGVFFANLGGAHFEGQPFKWFSNSSEVYTPIVGYRQISFRTQEPIYGAPQTVSGLRLVDARASYGVGLETFALGFPIHFD